MAIRKTGISRDLIFHPGETIADILEERKITQAELAVRTGVSTAYVSNVIAGKKDISARFALALEYALGVPKSFWLNLQANYEAELLEYNEIGTIAESERTAREALDEVVMYLRKKGKLPAEEDKDESILSIRKALQISDISNLKNVIPYGILKIDNSTVDSNVLGAWIRICQMYEGSGNIENRFRSDKIDDLVSEIKEIMLESGGRTKENLKKTMARHGIDFSTLQSFRGAPVQGYISQKTDGVFHLLLTEKESYADEFWFSLFHELGHIVNGDVRKSGRYIDDGRDAKKEAAADLFASNKLIAPDAYCEFVKNGDFRIETIRRFAAYQRLMPYIVIGRLQREKKLDQEQYNDYRPEYKPA